jgi:hypothetical protein
MTDGREGDLNHRLSIARKDVRRFARQRRYLALARDLWLVLVLRHYSETCQVCGRRYDLSSWVASTEMYVAVKGNGGGTFCPRCFTDMANAKGLRILWTPVYEREGVHGDIMDGQLKIGSAPHD